MIKKKNLTTLFTSKRILSNDLEGLSVLSMVMKVLGGKKHKCFLMDKGGVWATPQLFFLKEGKCPYMIAQMSPEDATLSQSQKDKYHMTSLI